MIVAFARNQGIAAKDTDTSTITTDPHPVGDANYIEATLSVDVFFSEASNASLTYKLQGSNDGQNWFDISGFTETATAVTGGTPLQQGGDVTCAFVRGHFSFGATADTGISYANFDLHANFTRK